MTTTSPDTGWRLPSVDPEAFTPEERELYAEVTSGPHNPTGPTAIWSRSPVLARAALDFGNYIRYTSVLEPRLRELAILTVARETRCPNEQVAHEPLAVAAGLEEGVVVGVRTGNVTDADPVVRNVHDFVTRLVRDVDVPEDLYRRVADVVGDRGVVDLVSTVGFYTMIAMLLSATKAPVTPPGARRSGSSQDEEERP